MSPFISDVFDGQDCPKIHKRIIDEQGGAQGKIIMKFSKKDWNKTKSYISIFFLFFFGYAFRLTVIKQGPVL